MLVEKGNTGLWIVDVQKSLFPLIERKEEVQKKLRLLLESAKIWNLPLIVSEQYPEGLGSTIEEIISHLPKGQIIYPKTTFSGYLDPEIRHAVDHTKKNNWIVTGIETHICVLQTAKDLQAAKKNVIIAADAVGCRKCRDHEIALEECRQKNIRVTSTESILYELLRDAKSPEFKKILSFVKSYA